MMWWHSDWFPLWSVSVVKSLPLVYTFGKKIIHRKTCSFKYSSVDSHKQTISEALHNHKPDYEFKVFHIREAFLLKILSRNPTGFCDLRVFLCNHEY